MYSFTDLVGAYRSLGLKRGDLVVLKTDLMGLGPYEKYRKADILNDHLRALNEVIDLDRGTVVVATSTTNLCNTNIPWSSEKTPSVTGILTEHIRQQPDAIRSHHAFESYTALGRQAAEICLDVSRHAYGIDTPEQRLIEMDATCVSLGIEPRRSCATVHHVEMMVGTPYRYVKEYHHPVEQKMTVTTEIFYRYVWYRDCGIERNRNKKLFASLECDGLPMRSVDLGSGTAYAYPLNTFFSMAKRAFRNNMYIWLEHAPTRKPWQK